MSYWVPSGIILSEILCCCIVYYKNLFYSEKLIISKSNHLPTYFHSGDMYLWLHKYYFLILQSATFQTIFESRLCIISHLRYLILRHILTFSPTVQRSKPASIGSKSRVSRARARGNSEKPGRKCTPAPRILLFIANEGGNFSRGRACAAFRGRVEKADPQSRSCAALGVTHFTGLFALIGRAAYI